MIIINNFKQLDSQLKTWRLSGEKIGFVPTMGALHEGHVSLIKQSKSISGKTLCSIFINPLQFNNSQDFEKYPVTPEKDIQQLESAGSDLLFFPSEQEVYPDKLLKEKHYDLGHLENMLEGKFRPGHFQGVCRVMERLLRAIKPDFLFLGKKDYQQCLVIEKLIWLENLEVSVIRCPTLREKNGLAKSSRNLRLSPKEQTIAGDIYKRLLYIKNHIRDEPLSDLLHKAGNALSASGFEVEYIALAHSAELHLTDQYDPTGSYVLLVAAWLNGIRLIDNLEI